MGNFCISIDYYYTFEEIEKKQRQNEKLHVEMVIMDLGANVILIEPVQQPKTNRIHDL